MGKIPIIIDIEDFECPCGTICDLSYNCYCDVYDEHTCECLEWCEDRFCADCYI